MFVDASAMVAIITGEAERMVFDRAIRMSVRRQTSGIAVFEAAHAVARKTGLPVTRAAVEVNLLIAAFDMAVAPLDAEDAEAAILAASRYGKGSGHPARLNMGDCFAYAMATRRGLALLFKGDDFGQTDVRSAVV